MSNEPAQRIAQAKEIVRLLREKNLINNHAQDCSDMAIAAVIADALKQAPTATLKADRLIELADEQCITDRDRYEEALGDIAYRLGCREEWSNNHSHLDCIYELLPDPAPLAGTWSREKPTQDRQYYWYKRAPELLAEVFWLEDERYYFAHDSARGYKPSQIEGWFWPVPLAAPEFEKMEDKK